MTDRHHQSSVGSTYKPTFEPWQSTNSETTCVSSGMVTAVQLSEEPNTLTTDSTVGNVHIEDWQDDASTTSSETDDCQSEKGALEVAGPNECVGSFGNVVVKNSSQVQFGNNTYYRGPVVIKQFVYKGEQNGQQLRIGNGSKDSSIFIPDSDIVVEPTISDCVKSDKTNFINNNASRNDNIASDNVAKGAQWLNYVYRNRILFISFTTLSIIALIVCLSIILGKHDPVVDLSPSDKLRIVSRIEWLAQPPSRPASPLHNPVPYVIILHTETENCLDEGDCVLRVRYLQTLHIDSNGGWDIADNFLVGGDGLVYEGRGWQSEGADAFGYNSRSIEIAIIGTFNNVLPPGRQLNAAKRLIEEGVRKGFIMEDYKLLAHSQISGTQSTGELLYKEIKTWPHWWNTCGDLPVDEQPANASNISQPCR